MENRSAKSPATTGLSYNHEPIVALATPKGHGAIAVIRLSGQGCHELLRDILVSPSGGDRKRKPLAYRTMALYAVKGDKSGPAIDEVCAVHFKGPRSFTGEDSAEIYPHGSPYIVDRIITLCLRAGFRAADPGEFTKRAFLNGKMDLTQSEGLKELVKASSQGQWLAARQLATGSFRREIESLRGELIDALALLSARIDFPEEGDTQDIAMKPICTKITSAMDRISALVESYDNGKVAASGLQVAIIGSPNVGKSTLLNTLLHRDRAIVTDIPGTTRDYLEEPCLVNGRLLRLIDTAGIRAEGDAIENIGIATAKKLAAEADLVLVLAELGTLAKGGCADVAKMVAAVGAKDCLYVATKSDLASAGCDAQNSPEWLAISCHTGEGIPQLERLLAAKVDRFIAPLNQRETFVASARHLAALEEARRYLKLFWRALEEEAFDECLVFELQNALRALASIIGVVFSEDILAKIFSEFCVGK